jgi:hypothetical protein
VIGLTEGVPRRPWTEFTKCPDEELHGLGRLAKGEAALAQAVQARRRGIVVEQAARDLAYSLKQQGRREEALPWWEELG